MPPRTLPQLFVSTSSRVVVPWRQQRRPPLPLASLLSLSILQKDCQVEARYCLPPCRLCRCLCTCFHPHPQQCFEHGHWDCHRKGEMQNMQINRKNLWISMSIHMSTRNATSILGETILNFILVTSYATICAFVASLSELLQMQWSFLMQCNVLYDYLLTQFSFHDDLLLY